MKTTGIKIFAVVSLIIAANCCTVQENSMEPVKSGFLELSVEYPSFEVQTKASGSQEQQLFAYPLPAEFSTAIEPLAHENYVDGSYYFSIPENTQNILFSNIGSSSQACNVSFPAPDAVLRIESRPDSLVGTDIVFGKVTSYSPDATKYSISLKRAVAKLRITLRVTTEEDTLYNLTSRFDSVTVKIGDLYTSMDLTPALDTVYAGSGSFSVELGNLPSGCVADNLMTFPSLAYNPPIVLSVKLSSGEKLSFESVLPGKINSNRYYDIILSLSQNNASMGFSLEDIEMHDVKANYWEGSFSLIEFSNSRLYFGESANLSQEIVVNESVLGTWYAEVPGETLRSFSVRNKTNGNAATSSSPTISGEKGDTIVVTTLVDNGGSSESLYGEILFRPNNNHNVYPVSFLQSNGMTQRMIYNSRGYHNVWISGTNLVFNKLENDGSVTEIQKSDYSISQGLYDGVYEVTGSFITEFSISDITMDSIRFVNCNTLSSLSLSNTYFYGDKLDMSELPLLENCNIYFNDQRQIELLMPETSKNLKSISFDNVVFESLDLEGFADLSYLYVWNNTSLKDVNLRGCISLSSIAGLFDYNSLTNIDISNSGLTELSLYSKPNLVSLIAADCQSLRKLTLENDFSSLTSFDISGSSALETVVMANLRAPSIASLDFSGMQSLDSLRIDAYSSSEFPLSELNLGNCQNLRSVELGSLDVLNTLNLSGSYLRDFYIHDCGMLPVIDFSQSETENLKLRYCGMLVSILPNIQTIKSVDVSYCDNIQELNLSNSPNLYYVNIENSSVPSYSTEIPNIDGCSSLRVLRLSGLRKSSLDLSSMANLETLEVWSCSYMESVNCSGLSNLSTVIFDGTHPVSMYFAGCSSIDSLVVYGNYKLNTLDLSGMSALRHLSVENSLVTDLTLDNASSLEYLSLRWNQSLTNLYIPEGNRLKFVILQYNSSLPFANVQLNAPNTLEKLKISECSINEIEDGKSVLDLQNYTSLRLMQVRDCYNFSHVLNMNGCSALEWLDLSNSIIGNLDLNGCSALKMLDLQSCSIETSTLNGVFTALPVRSSSDIGRYCISYASSPTGNLEPDTSLLNGKSWYVLTSISDIDFDTN